MMRSVSPSAVRSRSSVMRPSAASRSAAVILPRCDLPVEVAADDLGRPVERLLGDVVQHHVEAREREDLGDAVAHLSGADDADPPDFLHSASFR